MNPVFNFETHLTVNCSIENLEKFKEACAVIDAKPIIINFKDGEKQVMTSKTEKASTSMEIYRNAKIDTIMLQEHGFDVIRAKIEAEPRYIDSMKGKVIEKDMYKYYEIHVPCHTDKINVNVLKLLEWHVSKNEFKPNVTMLTYRTTHRTLEHHINLDIERMIENGMVTDDFKHHYEFAIYDTNVDLDNNWMGKGV